MNLNSNLLKAKIFHGLKSLTQKDDTIQPRYLEIAICESFGCKHVGDSAYYADGIIDNIQLSVKTRMLQPNVLKRKEGRDFQSHPEKFLGSQINKKQSKITNGLEIVQRRQQLNVKNDSTADPEFIGKETIKGFLENIEESKLKYNVSTTFEVIGIHGYDCTKKFYLMSLFWKEHELYNLDLIKWKREGYGVAGYIDNDNVSKKIYERINGNAKREATCFKEYKNLNLYENKIDIKIPIPTPWSFDLDQILNEITEIEKLDQFLVR